MNGRRPTTLGFFWDEPPGPDGARRCDMHNVGQDLMYPVKADKQQKADKDVTILKGIADSPEPKHGPKDGNNHEGVGSERQSHILPDSDQCRLEVGRSKGDAWPDQSGITDTQGTQAQTHHAQKELSKQETRNAYAKRHSDAKDQGRLDQIGWTFHNISQGHAANGNAGQGAN